MAARKLFLGRQVKRLRRDLGLNQSAMAAEIGVSPSYLNHLERNQRPLTAAVLLRLAEAYDVDLKSFAAEGGEGTDVAQLAEIFADPLLGGFAVPRYELVEVADNAPAVADALARLYAALVELRRGPAAKSRRKAGCATASRPSATTSRSSRRRPRRWPARSATRSPSSSRSGAG
jgi:transcriptional regulator with XRE-family HTH domain